MQAAPAPKGIARARKPGPSLASPCGQRGWRGARWLRAPADGENHAPPPTHQGHRPAKDRQQ
eukprot:1057856-Lingulodinium_polyedra.AAC.1